MKYLLFSSLILAKLWCFEFDERVAQTLPYTPAKGAHITAPLPLVATAPSPIAVPIPPTAQSHLLASETAVLVDSIEEWIPK